MLRCFDALYQLSVADLEYPRREMPQSVHLVGPLRANDGLQGQALPSWWADLSDERPIVHVTQSTIDNVDFGRLIVPTLQALAEYDLLDVVSTGGRPLAHLDRALGGSLPENARAATRLPYDRLLPLCDVVVTNGGFGGVQRALAHGVPLVVAGSTEDKPEVAARVAWAGCGRDMRTGTPSAKGIARAVSEVLTDPSFSAQSKRMATVIAALPKPIDVIAEGLKTAT